MLTPIQSKLSPMETYGKRFKRLRERAGFVREADAAREIGVSREAIIQLEDGKTKELKGSNAVLAAATFGVTTDYLITGVEIEGTGAIVDLWLKLDVKRRELLLGMAENLLHAQQSPITPSVRDPFPSAPKPEPPKKKARQA